MQIYTPPTAETLRFFGFYADSLRRRLTGAARTSRPAHEFFGEIYQSPVQDALLDGQTPWYLQPLDLLRCADPELFDDPAALALDLGTGRGTACRWLYDHGWRGQTLGLDFIPGLAGMQDNLPARHQFRVADLAGVDILPVDSPVSLVLAVNTLSYLPDPAALLRRLRPVLAPGARLMVIEPWPSLYWLPPAHAWMRTPRQWNGLMRAGGWTRTADAALGLFRCRSMPLLPLAQAALYRLDPGAAA